MEKRAEQKAEIEGGIGRNRGRNRSRVGVIEGDIWSEIKDRGGRIGDGMEGREAK